MMQTSDPSPATAGGTWEIPGWIPQPVVEAWQTVDAHPVLAAAIIVGLSFLVAKLSELILVKGVTRLTRRTHTEVDDQLIRLLHRPLFIAVFFLGLAVALRSLRLNAGFTRMAINLLQTLVVLVWLTAGFRGLRILLDALARHTDRFSMVEERTLPLFDILGKLLLIGGASYVVLLTWNIDPTAWLASAGVIGIAVGFAAKDTLANLFAGFFIVADAPYKLGDFIILDSGERGRVTHVGLRSTRLLTRDDIEITLPNAVIANAKIINESGGPWEKERIRIKVGVAYGSDVDQVCEVLKGLALTHAHICTEPEPRVRFRQFGASSLDFELLAWIDEPVLRGKLSHELNMEIYKEFARLGIEIPYAKQDVYIKEMPGS